MANLLKSVPKEVGCYRVIYLIGAGSYSAVFHAVNTKTNETAALKFISRKILKSHRNLESIERELRIFQRLQHKNIAKYYETIYLKDFIVIAMELLRFNHLPSTLANIAARHNIILRWAKEILEGLEYIHNHGISHHDIKPENIAFDPLMQVKIIDFGLCEETSPGDHSLTCSKPCGTPFYVAPEVITKTSYDGRKSDIWSFGVTLHVMATGRLPYIESLTYKQLISNIHNIEKFIDIQVKGDLKELIEKTLIIDPKERPTATELLHSKIFENAEIIRYAAGNPLNRSNARSSVMKHPLFEKNSPKIVTPMILFTSAKLVPSNYNII